MNPKRKICILKFFGCIQAIMLVACSFCYGQIKCQIKHYSTEEGLSHEKITSILKDKDGFMWFGTWDGINRFDGHTFITFKSYAGDNSNIKINRVFDIVEDNAGYLWVITADRQVYRFDKKTGHFFPALKAFGSDRSIRFWCNKVIPCKSGVIWLMSENQGIIAVSKPYQQNPVITKYAANISGSYHLPAKSINFFHEDKQQNVWIGTPNGLVQLLPDASGKYVPSTLDHQYANHNFTSITEDDNGIVFTTKDGFVVLYDKKSRQFLQDQFPQTQGINAACLSKKNNIIYCATVTGELLTLNRADLKLQSTIKIDNKPIFSIFEDHSNRLWIEPNDNGVFKYDLVAKKLKYFSHKLYASTNTGTNYLAFEDVKGCTWINMKGHGFGYYDADKDNIDPFYNDPNFEDYRFSNKAIHVYYDAAGVLWLATEKRGLEKVVMLDNSFHQQLLVPHTFIQTENEVRSVYHDHENRLWIGAKENLYTFFSGKRLENMFVNPPKEGLQHVYGMCEDRNGNLWFASKETGLYKAEPVKNKTQYRLTNFLNDVNDPYSISNNLVYSVIEDKKGRIWVGTHGGGMNLVFTKNNQTKFYNINNAFKNYPKNRYLQIRHVATDLGGNIWMGTTDGVLILDIADGDINKFRFKGYSKVTGDKESLGNNDVQFVYRDNAGEMWLCTSGGGLNLVIGKSPLQNLKFKAYTIKNGLSNDFTLSCVQDNSGKLWIATQKGISELNIAKQRFKNYDSNDGLPQTGFSESCGLKLPDGSIVFGAFTGYLRFKPEAVADQKINANMALTSLQVDGKDINSSDNDELPILKTDINYAPDITLKYDQNDLNFTFSVLDYRTSDRQAYTYRMLGLDTGWTQSGINHLNANYSNLPPGDYTFQVKSINEDRYFSTPFKQLPITILPPLWRTWWAYLIYIIITLITFEIVRRTILTMLKLRHRIAVEQHLTELKLNFFTNISHELRTPLTLILNPIDAIAKDRTLSEKGREYAEIIMKNANRMVRFINQLLDLRKVQSGKAVLNLTEIEILGFVKNIGSYFNELGKEKEISLTITSNVNELSAWVDAEKLDIVIYNLLSNAYKFSEKGSGIVVGVEKDSVSGYFCIKIIDQGVGVAKDKLEEIFELYYEGEHKAGDNKKGTGIGLALAKELIVLHHGKIFAANNSDKGLTISIELKLGKPDFDDGNIKFLANDESHFIPDEDIHGSQLLAADLLKDKENDIYEHPLVLLVEDNSDLRRFLAVQLSENYRVAEAENGKDGYEKALNLSPDLIVSDVMMPVMDGIQLLDKLKNDVATSHIPVILLSAKYSVDNQLQGLKYGADLYIAKPFNNELLLASVANLIKQRKKLLETIVNVHGKVTLSPSDVVMTAKDEDFLKKIIKVVEEGMGDPDFNIDDFADAIGMSRSVFFRKLKTLTNSSPVEFLRDMRVKRGKQLLDAGETNIAQVAYAVGFNDAKYFGACFKKQYHHTPSDYLKSINA